MSKEIHMPTPGLARTPEGYPIIQQIDGTARYTYATGEMDLASRVDIRNPYVEITDQGNYLQRGMWQVRYPAKRQLTPEIVPFGDGYLAVTFRGAKRQHSALVNARRAECAAAIIREQGGITTIAQKSLGHLAVQRVQEFVPYEFPHDTVPATQQEIRAVRELTTVA